MMSRYVLCVAVVIVFGAVLVTGQPYERPGRPTRCGPVCAIYCPNGNVLDRYGCPTCRCRQVKTDQCPPNNIITTCQIREDHCYSDSDCAPFQRCCRHGCGRKCKTVRPFPWPLDPYFPGSGGQRGQAA